MNKQLIIHVISFEISLDLIKQTLVGFVIVLTISSERFKKIFGEIYMNDVLIIT